MSFNASFNPNHAMICDPIAVTHSLAGKERLELWDPAGKPCQCLWGSTRGGKGTSWASLGSVVKTGLTGPGPGSAALLWQWSGANTAGCAAGLREGSRELSQLTWQGNAQPQTLPDVCTKLQLQKGAELWIRSRAGGEREPCPTKGSRTAVSRAPGAAARQDGLQEGARSLNIHSCVIRGCQCIAAELACPLTCPSRAQGSCGCGMLSGLHTQIPSWEV